MTGPDRVKISNIPAGMTYFSVKIYSLTQPEALA